MAEHVEFSAAHIKGLFNRARKAGVPAAYDSESVWVISPYDPADVLRVFRGIWLKPGYSLRAYLHLLGGNGKGFVCAMPTEARLPDPLEWEPRLENIWEPPKPACALDHLMDAIDGDGSLESYLSASLFYREMMEYGARWHGCAWSTHEILDGSYPGSDNLENWSWRVKNLRNWAPCVIQKGDEVRVRFYSYSGLDREAIYRNADRFQAGAYRMRMRVSKIARGSGGYIF